MKVFIHVGAHPQYKEIINYPPKGVKYEVKGESVASRYYSKDAEKARLKTNKLIKIFGVPRMYHYKTDADIIFSTRGIIPLNNKPWVAELEHPYAFAGMDYRLWGVRQKLLTKFFLGRKNCKTIMPNSTGAYIALEKSFDIKKIIDKIEIVYLSIHYKKIKKIRHDGINLLTISNVIYDRGFNLIKDVYSSLKKKHPGLTWTIKTNSKLNEEDETFVRKQGIKIIRGVIPDSEMDKLFGSADIFLYPSFVDINAMVLYEAMRAGLPVITTDTYGFRDKVIPYENGLMIHDPGVFWDSNFLRKPGVDTSRYHNKKMSKELADSVDYLVNHRGDRLRMGKNAENIIKSGFLSIGVRNEKLRRIFENALKH